MSKSTRESFEAIYRKIGLPLTKFIVKRVGGDQEAVDEVLSRTLTAAWKGWKAFEHKSSYFTWICRIALNKIADYYREQVHENSKIIAPGLEEIAHYDSRKLTPEEWYVLNELCNSVKACIRLLPPEKQELLYLRYWRGLAIKQIAKELGMSERAIEGKLYRARQLFKRVFSAEYPSFSELPLKEERK